MYGKLLVKAIYATHLFSYLPYYLYLVQHLHKSVPVIKVRPPGYFVHISITTPVVPAWKHIISRNF
jgi:hypothetical protein